MSKLRDYLQLFRAHTGMATVYTLVIPYLFEGGREYLIPLFFAGLLAHYSSFGHNSVMDLQHDLEDPGKVHHPLVAGRLSYATSLKVVLYLQLLVGIYLSVIAYLSHSLLSLVFLLIYTIMGHAYNDGLDHSSLHSWFPISLAFASLTMYSVFLLPSTTYVDVVFFLLSFLTIFYQIAYEGNKKEGGFEDNLYSRYKGKWWFEFGMASVRIVGNSVLIILLLNISSTIIQQMIFLVLTILEILLVMLTHSVDVTQRKEMLKYFGLTEAVEFFRIMTVVPPLLYGILLLVGLVYYLLFNKVLWGDSLLPHV